MTRLGEAQKIPFMRKMRQLNRSQKCNYIVDARNRKKEQFLCTKWRLINSVGYNSHTYTFHKYSFLWKNGSLSPTNEKGNSHRQQQKKRRRRSWVKMLFKCIKHKLSKTMLRAGDGTARVVYIRSCKNFATKRGLVFGNWRYMASHLTSSL